jgi:hypothetical protein
MFNSYVKLPEGTPKKISWFVIVFCQLKNMLKFPQWFGEVGVSSDLPTEYLLEESPNLFRITEVAPGSAKSELRFASQASKSRGAQGDQSTGCWLAFQSPWKKYEVGIIIPDFSKKLGSSSQIFRQKKTV